MAVVGRGGEKDAVLKQRRQIAKAAGEAGIDRVTKAVAGRSRVVRLIEDQQRLQRCLVCASLALLQPHPQQGGILRIAQQRVGNQEAAGGAPGVGAVATLLPHLGQIGPVHHREGETKAAGHLLLPLAQH